MNAETMNNQQSENKIDRWNWGAVGFSWIWGIANKVWWFAAVSLALLILNSVVENEMFKLLLRLAGLALLVVAGLRGNRWAWQHRKFESVEQFHKVQYRWAQWAIAIMIVVPLIAMIVAIALVNTRVYKATSTQPIAKTSDNSVTTSISQGNVDTDSVLVKDKLEVYLTDNQHYPSDLSQLIPQYLPEIPASLSSIKPYKYVVSNDGQRYDLYIQFSTRGVHFSSDGTVLTEDF